MGRPRNDLSGLQFGRLFVVKYVGRSAGRISIYECICDCGITKEIYANNLTTGDAQSCGCLMSEVSTRLAAVLGKANLTHGMSKTLEYRTWQSIIQRCYNPKADREKRYFYRGIEVCDRWLESFDAFIFDMGFRPDDKTSIERLDNGGDYSPENCIWGDADIQNNNKSHKGWKNVS